MRASKTLAFHALMWLGTGLVVLAGTELVLPRILSPEQLSRHRWGSRPHTFLPGVVQRAVTPNYDVAFRTNWLGYNDVEHEPGPALDRHRVLLLGDSFAEAMQVPPESSLARRLEQLAARDGRRLEVISMAISGYGQSHELATYEALGRGFYPDVVVAFFCVNDLWNNAVGVEGEDGPALYRLDADGRLASNLDGMAERPPTFDEYRKHLRPPRFPGLRLARRLLRASWRAARDDVRDPARAAALGELPDAPPHDPREVGQRAPRSVRPDQAHLFEALVAELARVVVDRDGHRLLAVSVSGDLYHERTRGFGRLVRWVAHTFGERGVPHLDVDALFRERARHEGRPPSWETDAHWNETGHAWAAEALYAELGPWLAPGATATPTGSSSAP